MYETPKGFTPKIMKFFDGKDSPITTLHIFRYSLFQLLIQFNSNELYALFRGYDLGNSEIKVKASLVYLHPFMTEVPII